MINANCLKFQWWNSHCCTIQFGKNVLSISFWETLLSYLKKSSIFFLTSTSIFLSPLPWAFKSTFTQDSRVLTLPLPLVRACSFSNTPPLPKVPSFWLELNLSPSISVLVKFREKKLIISTSIFGWTQRFL